MAIRFSIIIPAYADDKAIALTLHSIRKAISGREDSFEILIIDSSPNEKTVDAVSAGMESSRIPLRVIRSYEVLYPGAARNLGIREASSDNLILIDCGIVIDRQFIDECTGSAGAFDILWFRSEFIFSKVTEPSYVRPYYKKRAGRRFLRHCMINRCVFDNVGFFREDLRAAEDWLFYKAVKEAGLTEKFSGISAGCSGYPDNAPGFYKKWRTYFEHSVYAGLCKKNILISGGHIIILAGLYIVFGWLTSWPLAVLPALLIFILTRGFLSFLRSKIKTRGLVDIAYTFVTSLILEVARITGVILGLLRRRGSDE